MPWFAFYVLFIYLERLHKSYAHELELTSELYEARIGYYKNQLNPHFLFNALNCVRTLIETKADILAVDVTNKLSVFLRNSIDKSEHDLISIKEELEMVRDYLFIEKIRFGDRLNFRIEVEGHVHQARVPPMIIQLVENAVKHGIGKLRKGGDIFINVYEASHAYRIDVVNTGRYLPSNRSVVGLKNCVQRLNLVYRKEGLLEIDNLGDNLVKSQITIPK